MNQISKQSDIKLNKLALEISQADAVIETYTQEKDKAWNEVFDLFDEHGLEGKEARFISVHGCTLARQVRTGSPKLNEEMLQALVFQKYPRAEATRIWNSITKRVVDSTALEAAVRQQKIDPELVEQVMEEGKVSFARIRREWTKEDKEKARIMGIEKE